MIFHPMKKVSYGKDLVRYKYVSEIDILVFKFFRDFEYDEIIDPWTLLCDCYQWKAEMESLWRKSIERQVRLDERKGNNRATANI